MDMMGGLELYDGDGRSNDTLANGSFASTSW